MATNDRIEIYSSIRRALDRPLEQHPAPDQIIDRMFRDEQHVLLKLTNTKVAWSLMEMTLTTVIGQSEYTVENPLIKGQKAGKIYFVVRNTGENELPQVPVPFEEYNLQSYGLMPTQVNSALTVPEKLSVYRSDAVGSVTNIVIQPTPSEALTYVIKFYISGLDRNAAASALGNVPGMEELVDLRKLMAQVRLIDICQWRPEDGTSDGLENEKYNDRKRTRLRNNFNDEISILFSDIDEYLETIASPVAGDIGYWNDPVGR